ncbi:MAG: pyruvate:ferredoxin (flavodoxin) oxidoreductase [Polyangiaceae bacterium]|nr:pyruvate:ferredoxin (flavodoxin) oxidoreductase [Polyangiaceae bacterium]
MANPKYVTIDGNEAASSIAFRASEVIAIYPITPSSNMGEFADEWAAQGKKNVWGVTPDVQEMQSEGGAAGAAHGAVQAGALTSTFTASQGLLLKIPNMFKIAGELTPFCIHVSARTVATHALSIFGDHSDVMLCRGTGFALLSSVTIQNAHDLALVAHAATLRARVPFLHFFDGFRSSHELSKVAYIDDDAIRAMIPDELVAKHRERALSPDHPVLRGTAQNPDTFFQSREACNRFFAECPAIVQATMDDFAKLTGRQYHLFDYYGAPDAERVVVLMGSGAATAEDTVEMLVGKGEKVGALVVRLYRPFSVTHFLAALPTSAKKISVLDRTKEPGAPGEPLYQDVLTALVEGRSSAMPQVFSGRYGLSSKEFTPAMVKAVFDDLKKDSPKNHFTVGIVDDVTHTSLDVGADLDVCAPGTVQAMFYGLGSDGTVGANKNSIKIIGEETPQSVQGYFVYDSKKAGAITVSHLRFGPKELKAPYLVQHADFIGCHQFEFVDKYDVLDRAKSGGVFLLNSPYGKDEVWQHLPREMQQQIIEKKLKFYAIDGLKVAREAGMGNRINTVMQTCFFAISGVLPRDEAIEKIKKTIEKTYGRKGADVVARNKAAVDMTLANLHEIVPPAAATTDRMRPPTVPEAAPQFVKDVTAVMLANRGDSLPVSAFVGQADGTWPTATTQWEKRNIANEIPTWDPSICIQCNKCALVCPHAAIRAKVVDPAKLAAAPEGFKSVPFKGNEFKGQAYIIQVAPEDCTGCNLCVEVCPAKDKSNPKHKSLNMTLQRPIREAERARYAFFLSLPEVDRAAVKADVKGSQFLRPLFEYSGACAGCGETPYVKLMTQLFGDRLMIGNATGCSSIYGGNLPTTPYAQDENGRGPAWSNSLFEDNAEFAFGYRLAVDRLMDQAKYLLKQQSAKLGDTLINELLGADQSSEAGIRDQRARVATLRQQLAGVSTPEGQRLLTLADYLVKKSIWAVGGDGWAYDIGYGGLDHVLAQDRDVNILVLDTGVYSNTGGQQSKATPLGAAAKFASAGKEVPKKDLGLMAMSYSHVYVAQVAFGARDQQTVRAFVEADLHPGPSIIIAYSHCIAHGYDLEHGLEQQRLAVESGIWPLYRCDPRVAATGEPGLKIDMGATPKVSFKEYALNETRFRMVEKLDPKRFARLQEDAQRDATRHMEVYRQMAEIRVKPQSGGDKGSAS